MTSKNLCLLFNLLFIFSLLSCRKDDDPYKEKNIDSSDYRYEYVGEWHFKSRTIQNGSYTYTDSSGTQTNYYEQQTIHWKSETGQIYAVSVKNQIVVQFSESHEPLLMQVDVNGNLSCVGDCKGYGFKDDSPSGIWKIDGIYEQQLGVEYNSSFTEDNITKITGYKVE